MSKNVENQVENNAENNAVNFDDPQSVAEALAAADAAELGAEGAPKAKKERKPAGPKIIKVTYTADRDIEAGETIEFDYTLPASMRRGAVVGIPLEEMTDDQLKIEYRNANSVHYKTKKAGHDATKAAERLERVKAEMTKRGIQPTSRANVQVDAGTVAELIKSGKISVEDIQRLLDGDAGDENNAEATGE